MEIKGYKDFYKQDKLSIYNMDNMELMKQIPDKYFDISLIDPPYGININVSMGRRKNDKKSTYHKFAGKDSAVPSQEFFNELFRISQNQIIWGGNYMTEYLSPSPCWLVWDKDFSDEITFATFELAWTSFKSSSKKFVRNSIQQDRIHPTQKPISLYSWILEKYAKEGMKIFDSHLGSGSNAIASHYAKMEFIGCELDSDYYNDSVKRIRENTRQLSLLNLERA